MNIYGMTRAGLCKYFENIGENPAKAAIILDGIYKKGMTDFSGFGFAERNIRRLSEDFDFALPEVVEKRENETAAKLLLRLSDGEFAETVLMRQRFGNVVCVSTQVGCNMGCAFCRSGLLKRRRDLTTAEILGQVLLVSREFLEEISGVSVMGIGEPFDNFNAVKDFCELVTDDCGLAVGRRRVTVSTCGIVPKIREYAELPRPCSLAISLHAPDDDLRGRLMPINKCYSIKEVLDAAEYFTKKTAHRVTLEYVMLCDVNDSAEHAERLAKLIAGRDFYVNLIPYNSTDTEFRKSPPERVEEFCAVLKANGAVATKRREFGAELDAACGQLRADYLKKST